METRIFASLSSLSGLTMSRLDIPANFSPVTDDNRELAERLDVLAVAIVAIASLGT
jgi:hypothetical protein